MNSNAKLTIITLIGVILGMILNCPSFFIGDIVIGGIIIGAIAFVIGIVLEKRRVKKVAA